MGGGDHLEVRDQGAATETLLTILWGGEQEHHPGVRGGAAAVDGGGGWDDATPGVGDVVSLAGTFSRGDESKAPVGK